MEKLNLVVSQSQALRLAEFLVESKTGFSFVPDASNRWVAEPQCATMMEALRLGMALKELRIEPENLKPFSTPDSAKEKRAQSRAGRRASDNEAAKEISGVTLDLSAPLDLNSDAESPGLKATRENEDGLLFGFNGHDHELN